MERYFHYYFFEREKEMAYSVEKIGHSDTLLELLSNNGLSVEEHKRNYNKWPEGILHHAFMTAAKAYQIIDAPTEGVIVPYGKKGRNLVTELCASHELEKQFGLLKQAQQYTVNVFPHVLKKLREQNAIYPIQKGVEIFYLDERYYSETYGLSDEPVKMMEVQIA